LSAAHRDIQSSEINHLAKPNYSFEKRQRELAKKKQQDAKQAKKKATRDNTKTGDTRPAPPEGYV
jgi:hypothetical protein